MSKKIEKIQYRLLSPFGPSLLHGIMPSKVYKDFEKLVKRILKEKDENLNHGDHLAGRINDEYAIPEGDLDNTNVGDFLDSVVGQYAKEVGDRMYFNTLYNRVPQNNKMDYSVVRVQGWVNSMKTGEYNPLHFHPGCNITTVFFFNDVDDKFITKPIASYQKGPNDMNKAGVTDDGILEIVYSSARIMEVNSFRLRPAKSEFLIFPSYLLHTVYPFISDKKRITSSVNYIINSSSHILNFGG